MADKFINFITDGMTSVKYFVPLTIEANKRGIRSRYFVYPSGKYNCPKAPQNNEKLQEYSRRYGFDTLPAESAKNFPGIFFLIEGDGCTFLNSNHKKISLTYMTDYVGSFDRYIDSVDNVIFPSKYLAEYYDKVSKKNLYLGSPKYDIDLVREDILTKYGLGDNKIALVVFPRNRDRNKIDLSRIYGVLRDSGLKVLVKTRAKDRAPENLRGDHYFEDDSWFPHTSMELISISDLVVNFDSTAIKECVLLKKPMINFHIKPFSNRLDFLYDQEFCRGFGSNYEDKELRFSIADLMRLELSTCFEEATNKYLFQPGDSSARILNYFGM